MNPPALFLRFFRWYCHPGMHGYIEGDLMEVYNVRVQTLGKRRADLKFIIDVLLLFRPGIIRPMRENLRINQYTMFKNYFKVAFRIFGREKSYSLINLSGLALGFTCCLLIYLFIKDELSFDNFHQDDDRIYRVASAYMRQERWEPYSSNSWRTAELIESGFGEIEQMVRVCDTQPVFLLGDKPVVERRAAVVDDNFFQVFSFSVIKGNAREALKGPGKVVISQSMAAKYFGQEDPLGKVLIANDSSLQIQVTGVMDDMPPNSHFHFDFLISGETLRQMAPESLFTNVGWDSQYVYIKVGAGTNPSFMEARFPEFIDKNLAPFTSGNFKLFLQPLRSIHLYSNNGLELEQNGSVSQVYIFGVVGLFILAIACVNYMNLTTARSMRRAREVGMRKVLGAKKSDLVTQFLSESFIMTFAAMIIALLLAILLLPDFNRFAGKAIAPGVLFKPEVLATLVAGFFVIALFGGTYPSFVLSSFKPLNSMKGKDGGKSGFVFRKGLVLLQFVICIALIAASAVVFNQWEFLKNKELGIDMDMLVCVPLQTMDRGQFGAFRNDLMTNPAVAGVGACNMRMPGWISNSTSYRAQDVEVDQEAPKSLKIIRIDSDFLDVVGVRLMTGRNFTEGNPADTASIILNESAAAQLEWTDPLGRWIDLNGRRFNVVGLVKDFHFESLHREIPPTIFIRSPNLNFAYVKIERRNTSDALAHVEKVYRKLVANRDFTYTFVNEDVELQYAGEEKFTQTFTLFTGLAIIIACLGTFGLISFTAERRSKEIGIRKVLGATVSNVTFLLVREFIFLLLIASLIAWPATFYFIDGWISTFVYRTAIGVGPFLIASALAFIIVIATTSFRAIRAALANPVHSLRDE